MVASAQILPKDPNDDGVPSVTDPSVPLSYVGNDGSVSIGVNREGQTEGQLLGVFARNNARALVGQVWWDRAGAGGAQADYNWLWGGDPIAAREHPDQATVSRLSFALDQNAEHDLAVRQVERAAVQGTLHRPKRAGERDGALGERRPHVRAPVPDREHLVAVSDQQDLGPVHRGHLGPAIRELLEREGGGPVVHG